MADVQPVGPGDVARALKAAPASASPKLTAGQRLYRDLFIFDPVTGLPNPDVQKLLDKRGVPAVLPPPPVPIAPQLGVTFQPNAIGRDKDGRAFVINPTKTLPQRVRKIRVDLEAVKDLEITAPTAKRGTLIPRELTPLSLQPITEPKTRDIKLPALEDWLQIIPEHLREPAERQRRAMERAIAIRDTAVPPWKRVMGQIHAYLDNIEDALITGLVIARPFARFFPKLLGPLSYLAGTAELLNIASAAASFPSTKSLRVLLIKKALGRNPFLKSTAIKRASHLRGFRIGDAAALRASGLPNLARITRLYPSVGELLEVGQTAHDIFGVGILLGPLYGTLDELAFSVLKQDRIRLRLAPQGPLVSEGLKNLQRALPLLQPGAPITDKDYLLTLGSVRVNTNLLLNDLQGDALGKVLAPEKKKKRRPPGGTSQETLDVWESFGDPIVEDDFVWPGVFEAEPDPEDLGRSMAEGAIEESRRRIMDSDDPTFRDLATDLIADIADDTLRVWEGPDVETRDDLDTVPGVIITLAESGMVIDPDCDQGAIARTLEKAAQAEAFMVRSALPAEAIADIARREGCRLLPIAHES